MKTRVVLGTLGTCAALLGPRAPPLRRARIIRSDTEEPMLAGVKGPTNVEVEGLPWWWEYFWKLPITQRGNPGDPLNMGDTMHVFRGNIEQIYGDFPSVDGAPLAEGDISGLSDGTMYLGLDASRNRSVRHTSCAGPKASSSSRTIVARTCCATTRSTTTRACSEILEDIMGKGLIPIPRLGACGDARSCRFPRRGSAHGGMFGECSNGSSTISTEPRRAVHRPISRNASGRWRSTSSASRVQLDWLGERRVTCRARGHRDAARGRTPLGTPAPYCRSRT